MIRLLHLSQLAGYNVPNLVSFLISQNLMPIHAVVVSGFIQKNIYESTVSSSLNLTEIEDSFSLEKDQILCLMEPDDLTISEQLFSMMLYQPFFHHPFDPTRLEMVHVGNVQVLAIADLMSPGVPGINQDLFDLKVRLGDRRRKDRVRLFFSGLPPAKWLQRPSFVHANLKHFSFFLHGTTAGIEAREDHFSIGADGEHFNVVEVDDSKIGISQFKKEGPASFQMAHNRVFFSGEFL